MEQQYNISPIGYIRSPYKQKFSIPRQPRLINEARAVLEFIPPFINRDALRGIEEFSHLWLMFIFHENTEKGWSHMVRPPRLGGNERKGVFATRASFRPNGIGMSAVELIDVHASKGKLSLEIGGVDLLDNTPIIDIKPYIPYSDAIVEASGGFADTRPETGMTVSFSEQATQACEQNIAQYPVLKTFIEKLLKQDPRPAYKKNKPTEQTYGVDLYEFNVKWTVEANHNHVTEIIKYK
ncbi:tRNA (N6-threonylcarbamoyladenosine(37)-N6)-methyltransferase TrmO [Flocculibacter collagenilyticus]|uniref:tRNA (N6-threonylcarbamoyladenosine(37)-N6)-methyltransferase TrmO n=1 Tax=Flocculibacter collagenilyticus TaxID=2744479 RepID=UPI0018F3DD47|nr:tRNA (N6-threonylcarbamoyladenosine(37)-N6)-methyltransferase TrmO [Flocculibacter collagenilyticus]